jgi:hypothetical protein
MDEAIAARVVADLMRAKRPLEEDAEEHPAKRARIGELATLRTEGSCVFLTSEQMRLMRRLKGMFPSSALHVPRPVGDPDAARVLMLVGPGGCGKSFLATFVLPVLFGCMPDTVRPTDVLLGRMEEVLRNIAAKADAAGSRDRQMSFARRLRAQRLAGLAGRQRAVVLRTRALPPVAQVEQLGNRVVPRRRSEATPVPWVLFDGFGDLGTASKDIPGATRVLVNAAENSRSVVVLLITASEEGSECREMLRVPGVRRLFFGGPSSKEMRKMLAVLHPAGPPPQLFRSARDHGTSISRSAVSAVLPLATTAGDIRPCLRRLEELTELGASGALSSAADADETLNPFHRAQNLLAGKTDWCLSEEGGFALDLATEALPLVHDDLSMSELASMLDTASLADTMGSWNNGRATVAGRAIRSMTFRRCKATTSRKFDPRVGVSMLRSFPSARRSKEAFARAAFEDVLCRGSLHKARSLLSHEAQSLEGVMVQRLGARACDAVFPWATTRLKTRTRDLRRFVRKIPEEEGEELFMTRTKRWTVAGAAFSASSFRRFEALRAWLVLEMQSGSKHPTRTPWLQTE